MEKIRRQHKYNILHVFSGILKRLPAKKRSLFWIILSGMIFVGVLETITIGLAAFFISVVSDPAGALKSSKVKFLNGFIGGDFLAHPHNLIIAMGIAVLLLVVVKNTVKGVVTYIYKRYSGFAGSYLGEQMFNRLLTVPYEYHLARNSADLVLGVFWRQFFSKLLNAILEVLSDGTMVVIILLLLIVMNPILSVIVISVLGLSTFLIFVKVKSRLDRTLKKLKDYRQTINKDVTKAIHGIKDVRVFGREDYFSANFRRKAYPEARVEAMQMFLANMPEWLLEAVGFLVLVSLVFFMVFFKEQTSAEITGTVALFAVAFFRVLPAIRKIVRQAAQARQFIPFAENGLQYLDELEKIQPAFKEQSNLPESSPGRLFRHAIFFEDVSFRYAQGSHEVLKNLNFKISRGETLGIIGVSGAGKSTLVDLIIGLLIPTRGKIIIDDTILDHKQIAAWRKLVGYVPQAPYICDGSLAENVAFGLKGQEIDRSRVETCCRMAAMDELIAGLPTGIDALIGERGVKLSGGQRQRVAIARALYNSPEIMIFDEATSSLDHQSETAILQTIYSFKGKQTLIIIAHRLSTVEGCDKIVWLDDGRVRKTGSPDEILPEYRLMMKENKLVALGS